jgi:hypothetical protein
MRCVLVGPLVIAMVLLSTLSPTTIAGDTGSRSVFGVDMRWEYYQVFVISTSQNLTENLSITYHGPSIYANLTFTPSRGINCSIKKIDGIALVQDQTVNFTLNISIKQNTNYQMNDYFTAELINNSYSLYIASSLNINVIFPIDTEPRFNKIVSSYESGYNDMKNILCNKYENTLSFALTNLLPNFVAEGYVNLRLRYQLNGEYAYPLNLHSHDLIKLDYNRTQIVNLTVPVIEGDFSDEDWSNGELWFSEASHPEESIPLFHIELVNGAVKSVQNTFLSFAFTCGLSIKAKLNSNIAPAVPYGPFSVDYWNGTNLTILVSNLELKAYKDIRIMVLDIPGILTLSSTGFWNYSVAWSGDIAPREDVLVNVTVYSKISGYHSFIVYIDPDKQTHPGYFPKGIWHMINPTNVVFSHLLSGFQLTYPDEPYRSIVSLGNGQEFIYQDEIVSKDALVKYQIQPRAKGLDGATFGISVCLQDQIGLQPSGKFGSELDALSNENEIYIDHQIHTGGWLDQGKFADINIDSTQFYDNHTYTITVRPKILGYIGLIPYVKVGDHILLFDKDFENRSSNNNIDSLCVGGTTKTILVTIKADHSKYIAVSSLMPLIISIVLINVFLYKFPTKRKPLRPKKNKKRPR